MRRITLVTGGSRSGKSRFALEQAQALAGPKVFMATCPVLDEEMAARIRKHQAERPVGWQTMEAPEELAAALAKVEDQATVVVDCLTLWINNLLYAAENRGLPEITEAGIADRTRELIAAARAREGRVFFVTNEVGMGIVPGDPLSRRFRDLAGRCNQILASEADEVVLMVCGLPMKMKG